MSDGKAIEVAGVRKSYDGGLVHALDGVDLTVERGEFLAITGPSGSGKSTLLHLLAALDHADAGRVVVSGHDLAKLDNASRFRRTEIGLVFQLHNLLAHLDARQNVEIAMFSTHRSLRERRERADALLADVQLEGKEHRRPPQLSGGERQRVAIARALANEPPVLLADEPTGSLDSASVEHVLALLRRLRAERDVTIVMITHDEHVANQADRIVVLKDGRVSEETRPAPEDRVSRSDAPES